MKNSLEFDTGKFVTNTAEQDTGLCPQTRYELRANGIELEYLLAKYLPDNGYIT